MYWLYLIECKAPNHYYVGVTGDIHHRIRKHQEGRGSKFTQKYGFKDYAILSEHQLRSEAARAENEFVRSVLKLPGHVVSGAGLGEANLEQLKRRR